MDVLSDSRISEGSNLCLSYKLEEIMERNIVIDGWKDIILE